MNQRPIRLAHLVSHPIQYFVPLYRALAARPEVDLTVYFYSDATVRGYVDAQFGRTIAWDTPLLGGYRHRFLPSASRTGIGAGARLRPNWDIIRAVAREGYDALWLHGYAHSTTWLAAAAARLRGTQVLIRDDQTLLHARPAHKRALKRVALGLLYGQSYGLFPGAESKRHFLHYGVPDRRLFEARYSVDNAYFRTRGAELAPRRTQLKRSFGITDDAPVVLFCGKLIEKKQPLQLIEAFARVRAGRPCWLLFVGDGELRPSAEAVVARDGVPGVRFAGFLNQSELAAAYVAADVLALPSKLHETWGHVVNEAMNFGLPVIASDKVGCVGDLVRAGENGIVVAHDDAGALAAAIAQLVDDATLRARFGARSTEIISQYSLDASADGIVRACVAATRKEGAWRRHEALT